MIEKVIKLVIKIFTLFYQKIKTDLKKIQHSASVFTQKLNIF